MFFLCNILIAFALGGVEGILRIILGASPESDASALGTIYQLAIMIPTIAVGVRRIHDTDHRGWWVLVPFANLYLAVRQGDKGENRFGSDPKTTPADQFVATSAPSGAAVSGQFKTQGAGQAPNRFCGSCGRQCPEIAAYCPKCGTPRIPTPNGADAHWLENAPLFR